MRFQRQRASIGSCVFFALLTTQDASAQSVSAQTGIPRDEHGLAQWEARVFDDFPVRIELSGRAELEALIAAVPIAAFDRDQIRPVGRREGREQLVLETRVTPSEADALAGAGWRFERMEDAEQAGRRAMEEEWARQSAEGRSARADLGVYHTHAQIGTMLSQYETSYPTICDRVNIGNSVQGRELWTVKISDNVAFEEPEVEVRLAGTIHGNEPPPQEMLLYLLDLLTTRYGTDPVVTELVNETEIYITPCLNPDGLTAGTRRNAHNIDLNRNFPVPNGTIGDDGTWTEEPETIAVKNFGTAHSFVVSENGHTGTLVVNYPWDYTYTLTPDDAAIILLSLEYSTYNLPMYYGPFPQGITNGAQWYIIRGGLQDWSYAETGCIDVTIEMSTSYAPPAGTLPTLWNDNRESFLHFIRAARHGIRGRVTDSITAAPLAATVEVTGNAKTVRTDPDHGDYTKLLPTGTWTVVVTADGYLPKTIPGVATTWGTTTNLDVQLDPVGTGVAASAAAPVFSSSPNPFTGATTLTVGRLRSPLRISIFDAGGRLVRTLTQGALPSNAGSSGHSWDGRSNGGEPVPAGTYFARLQSEGIVRTLKLTRVR